MSVQPVFSQSGKLYQSETFKEDVESLSDLGLFDMYNDELFFGETEPVKRHEAAKALVDFLGYQDMGTTDVSQIFFDVPAYYEHSDSISAAYTMGLMKGVGDGLFAPENNILTGHFIKVIVNTLGYEWKANVNGGYPSGYFTAAVELGLLDGANSDMGSELTRGSMVCILYNALNTPMCIQDGFSGDSGTFTIDEDVTFLTYYHDIYIKTDIVNSNRTISLDSSFDANEEKVLIGSDIINVTEETSFVFDCIGCEVEYFYRSINDDKEKELVGFVVTNSQSAITVSSKSVISANSSRLVVEGEKKDAVYNISAAADFFYNERPVTNNLNTYMNSFTGYIKLIDINNDKNYDFCLITSYAYDEVTAVDTRLEKIYGINSSYDLYNAEIAYVQNSKGEPMFLADVTAETKIAVAKSVSGDYVRVIVLDNKVQITVAEIAADGVLTSDETKYLYSKSLSQTKKDLVSLGKTVVLTLDELGEVIWINEVDDELTLGYLIKTETSNVTGLEKPQVRLTILDTKGVVNRYMCAEKVKVDGVSKDYDKLETVLTNIKTALNLAGDGTTSQVIYYRVNSDNLLTEISTADPSSGKIGVKFSYNEVGELSIQNHGGNSGSMGGDKYAIAQSVPIFRVPQTNQEIYDDKYFGITAYAKDGGPSGGDDVKLDGYIKEENDVLCSAFVLYETVAETLQGQARLFIVDKVSRVANADGDECTKISGFYADGAYSFEVDPSVTVPELTKGDVITFNLDGAEVITVLGKVYDYETDTILSPFTDNSKRIRQIYMLSVYNAPVGSKFADAYTVDFTNGKPADDNLKFLNFITMNGAKNVFTFDCVNEEITQGLPAQLQDYLRSGNDHAKVLARYSYGYPMDYIIYQ